MGTTYGVRGVWRNLAWIRCSASDDALTGQNRGSPKADGGQCYGTPFGETFFVHGRNELRLDVHLLAAPRLFASSKEMDHRDGHHIIAAVFRQKPAFDL